MTGADPEGGVGELFQRLIEDGREVARSEIALQRARVLARVDRYRAAAIFFAVAGALALAALVALLVGLIMTMAPRIGPGWATTVTVGGAILVAGLFALIGRGRLEPREV
ncbi:putative Holin-X, holin superfamily III [Sphingomonas sp. EC-HK361]|uniref:phage holin family protein n=1 Tax=Sphingomonas sp. EC-HK361 TaxID=2038397 RepID=UPI0012599BFD|nr:phage holin family protein [Sphingomonas sp. EC-HK361]VVT07542.1 putative Holin-X, holin superfamily III [Sphingomonas sp. EC-HK361]